MHFEGLSPREAAALASLRTDPVTDKAMSDFLGAAKEFWVKFEKSLAFVAKPTPTDLVVFRVDHQLGLVRPETQLGLKNVPESNQGIISPAGIRSRGKDFTESSKMILQGYLREAESLNAILLSGSIEGNFRGQRGDPFISTTTSLGDALNRLEPENGGHALHVINIPKGTLVLDLQGCSGSERIILVPHRIPPAWITTSFAVNPDAVLGGPVQSYPDSLLGLKQSLNELGLSDLSSERLNITFENSRFKSQTALVDLCDETNDHYRALISSGTNIGQALARLPACAAWISSNPNNFKILIRDRLATDPQSQVISLADESLIPANTLIEIRQKKS